MRHKWFLFLIILCLIILWSIADAKKSRGRSKKKENEEANEEEGDKGETEEGDDKSRERSRTKDVKDGSEEEEEEDDEEENAVEEALKLMDANTKEYFTKKFNTTNDLYATNTTELKTKVNMTIDFLKAIISQKENLIKEFEGKSLENVEKMLAAVKKVDVNAEEEKLQNEWKKTLNEISKDGFEDLIKIAKSSASKPVKNLMVVSLVLVFITYILN